VNSLALLFSPIQEVIPFGESDLPITTDTSSDKSYEHSQPDRITMVRVLSKRDGHSFVRMKLPELIQEFRLPIVISGISRGQPRSWSPHQILEWV
jgi:hypothetical protein